MADAVLWIGAPAHPLGYEDGDIIQAFSERRILHVHTEHTCSPHLRPDLNPRTKGFLTPGTLAEDFKAASHKYLFERISVREVRRTDLATLEEAIFSDTPTEIDGQMQHIHVEEWIKRRLKHADHFLFGAEGAEYWYGGETTPQIPALDTIWQRIEAETQLLKANHSLWPLTNTERKLFLSVAFQPISDEVASLLMAPIHGDPEPVLDEDGKPVLDPDGEPVMQTPLLKKRANQIDWKAHYGERPEFSDKTQIADVRDEPARTANDVIAKDAEAIKAEAALAKAGV